MSVPDHSHTTSDMQSFTATGRPFKPRDQQDKDSPSMLALSNSESFGHGPANLLPKRYDDNSIITVPVMRPEDAGKADGHKKEKRSFFSSRRRSENSNITMKQMPRGEYLKHYAKDDAGQYVGTEEPAADCILRGEDVVKYRSKPPEYVHEVGSGVTSALPDDGVIR